MRAINATKERELAFVVVIADSALKRMKGLLGRETLEDGHSLLLKPCKGIHTIGMRFPIDVIFLDKRNVAIAVKRNLPPNRFTQLYIKATRVLELPAGILSATKTEVGDVIEIV